MPSAPRLRSRRWLLIPLIAVAAAVLAAACTTVEPQDGASTPQRRVLTINGTGEVNAAPDIAVVTLGVSVLRETVTQAQGDAARAMTAVRDALRARGVAEADIATSRFSLSPEYEFRGEQGRKLLGFRVENTVTAKIRDVAGAGDVIDAAVAAGGNDVVVDGVSFTVDDPAPLRDRARELAVEDARRRAEDLASLSGVTLGKVLEINESGGAPPAPVFEARAFAEQAAAAPPTPISGGQVTVSLSVFITYALED